MLDHHFSCGSCVSWFLYFGIRVKSNCSPCLESSLEFPAMDLEAAGGLRDGSGWVSSGG
jgi:hypothetical protein